MTVSLRRSLLHVLPATESVTDNPLSCAGITDTRADTDASAGQCSRIKHPWRAVFLRSSCRRWTGFKRDCARVYSVSALSTADGRRRAMNGQPAGTVAGQARESGAEEARAAIMEADHGLICNYRPDRPNSRRSRTSGRSCAATGSHRVFQRCGAPKTRSSREGFPSPQSETENGVCGH